MVAHQTRWKATAAAILAVAVSGCAATPPPSEAPTTSYTNASADPQVVRQIMADSAWLDKNRLPKHPEAGPQQADTCPTDKVRDRARRQLILPADLMTTMVLHEAKPWAFVRYDVDTTGEPINVQIEQSSGLKSFDRAAIETVTSWRFDLSGGLSAAYGCVADVKIS